tara:strand:+ start:4367 stop:4669 length:303 start_codon:yes stop_codon:yes gene_type:complete
MSNTVYVNVSGTWKEADNYYVNVNGTWKTGSEFQIKINSDWKGEASATGNLPTTAQILSLDYLDFTLPAVGILDAKASINSYSLDVLDFTLPVVGKAYLA